jgi:hypothetical protein
MTDFLSTDLLVGAGEYDMADCVLANITLSKSYT